jgi:hypothetical protein
MQLHTQFFCQKINIHVYSICTYATLSLLLKTSSMILSDPLVFVFRGYPPGPLDHYGLRATFRDYPPGPLAHYDNVPRTSLHLAYPVKKFWARHYAKSLRQEEIKPRCIGVLCFSMIACTHIYRKKSCLGYVYPKPYIFISHINSLKSYSIELV